MTVYCVFHNHYIQSLKVIVFYKSETKEHNNQVNIKLAILWFTVKSIMEFCNMSKFHVTVNRILYQSQSLIYLLKTYNYIVESMSGNLYTILY